MLGESLLDVSDERTGLGGDGELTGIVFQDLIEAGHGEDGV